MFGSFAYPFFIKDSPICGTCYVKNHYHVMISLVSCRINGTGIVPYIYFKKKVNISLDWSYGKPKRISLFLKNIVKGVMFKNNSWSNTEFLINTLLMKIKHRKPINSQPLKYNHDGREYMVAKHQSNYLSRWTSIKTLCFLLNISSLRSISRWTCIKNHVLRSNLNRSILKVLCWTS